MARPKNMYASNSVPDEAVEGDEQDVEMTTTTTDANDEHRVQGFEVVSSAPDPLYGDEPAVKVRVLPKGDGKIATGKFDRYLNKFTYHKRGDHLNVHPSIAKEQEDNGLVEIVDGD